MGLGLLQLALPLLLAAQNPGIVRLFPPAPTNYLTDVASLASPDEAAQINDLAARLRTATGAELAVVTLPTIGQYAPGDVALQIGRSWGVGGKAAIGDSSRNAGLVLLLVPRTPEHKGEIYLSTGRGIEGIITDAASGRMLDLILPELQQQRYGPALLLATQAIAAMAAKGYGVSDSVIQAADPFQSSAGGGAGDGDISPLIVVIIILVIFIALSAASRNRGGGRRRGGWGGGWSGGGWSGGGWGGGSWGGGGGGGGFGGFGGGGGFSGGGAGRSF